MRILKYELSPSTGQYIEMPKSAKVLKVGSVHNRLFVWAMVDDVKPSNEVKFYVFATGQKDDMFPMIIAEYLDTVIMDNGLVWHIFKE